MAHYTYIHKTKDTGECFYVGSCYASDSIEAAQKAMSRKNREKEWLSIVRRHGFVMEFVRDVQTFKEFEDLKARLLNYQPKPRRLSDETRAKMSAVRKGRPSGRLGKTISEETRLKMSDARKGRPSHRLGKTMSEETKTKMSESRRKYYAKLKEKSDI